MGQHKLNVPATPGTTWGLGRFNHTGLVGAWLRSFHAGLTKAGDQPCEASRTPASGGSPDSKLTFPHTLGDGSTNLLNCTTNYHLTVILNIIDWAGLFGSSALNKYCG